MDPKTGVILLAFGGPDSPEAVEPFIENLLGGRKPPPIVIEKAKERYNLIGGKSPLPQITDAQAQALEQELGLPVRVGMRYWHPSIKETMSQMAQEGFTRVVGLSLAPHYSRVSTGTYLEEAQKASQELAGLEFIAAGDWYDNPLFVEAIADNVKNALEGMSAETVVIFSAHSLPVQHIKDGDPYVDQLEATVREVQARLGPNLSYLAYQSKGGGQGEWLGPMVEEVMDRIASEGGRDVMVVPVGFISDHVETLYDIDIAIRGHAEKLGLHFARSQSLNTSPKFIKALAQTVREAL